MRWVARTSLHSRGTFLLIAISRLLMAISPWKIFPYRTNKSFWCTNNLSCILFKINLKKDFCSQKKWLNVHVTRNTNNGRSSVFWIIALLITAQNLMKFRLHIRITKENAHNNFQILFFIRSSWKTTCLYWPFVVTLHIFLKGSF